MKKYIFILFIFLSFNLSSLTINDNMPFNPAENTEVSDTIRLLHRCRRFGIDHTVVYTSYKKVEINSI